MHDDQRNRGGEKPSFSKRLTRWIGILSSIFVVGFVGYWAFNLGKRDASEVPVIAAMDGEARTAPEGEENTQEDYQGLEVNEVLEGNTPQPDADIALAPDPDDLSNIEPANPDADPSETGDPAEAEAPSENTGNEELVDNTSLTLDTPPRRPELLYVPSETTAAQEPASPQVEETATEEVVEAPEATQPEPEPEPDPQPEAPAPSGEDLGPRLPAGAPLIQLAANTTADATRSQWAQLQADNQDVLGDKQLYIEKAEVNGKIFYRLRVQGFASSEQTRAACATLMARNVQCLAVTNQ